MAAASKPVLFEVLVDTKTGEVNLRKFAGEVKTTMQSVSTSSGGALGALSQFKLGILGVVGAVAAIPLVSKAFEGVAAALRIYIGWVKEGIAGSIAQENAERRLAAALRARGEAVNAMLPGLVDWAGQMQYVIGVGDDAILSQQALSMQMGLTVKQAKALTQVTADAATALGKNFDEVAFMFTRAVAGGHMTALTRLGIKLDETVAKSGDATKIIGALGEKFEGVAATGMQTFDKALGNVAMATDEFKEALADMVVRSPAVQAALVGLQKVITDLTTAISTNSDVIKPVILLVVDFAVVGAKAAAVTEMFAIRIRALTDGAVNLTSVLGFLSTKFIVIQKAIELVRWAAEPGEISERLKQTETTWAKILKDLEETRAKVAATSGELRAPALVSPRAVVTGPTFGQALSALNVGNPEDRIAEVERLSDAVAVLRGELGKAPDPQLRQAIAQALKETQTGLVDAKVKAGMLTAAMGELQKASLAGASAFSLLLKGSGLDDPAARIEKVNQLSLAVATLRREVGTAPDPQMQLALKKILTEAEAGLLNAKQAAGLLSDEMADLLRAAANSVSGVKRLGIQTDEMILAQAAAISMALGEIKAQVEAGTLSWNDYVRAMGAANAQMAALVAAAPQLAGSPALQPPAPGFDIGGGGNETDNEARFAREQEYQQRILQLKFDSAVEWSDTAMMLEFDRMDSYYQSQYDAMSEAEREKTGIYEAWSMERDAIDKRYSAGRMTLAEQEAQHELQLQMQLSSAIGGLIVSMFGDSKEAAIAQALINTYEGMTKALAQGGIYGGILAAIVFAAGMAQISKIRNTNIGSSGGSGGGMSTSAPSLSGSDYTSPATAGSTAKSGSAKSAAGASTAATPGEYGTYAGRYGGSPYEEPGTMALHDLKQNLSAYNTININAMDSGSLSRFLLENPDNRRIVGDAAYARLTGR
jgi:hypothetical protein